MLVTKCFNLKVINHRFDSVKVIRKIKILFSIKQYKNHRTNTKGLGMGAESSRLRILQLLSENEMTVTELAKALNLSKSTVSYHIGSLLREGLIKVSREERVKNFVRIYYTLASPSDTIVLSLKKSLEERDRGELFRNMVRLLGLSLLNTSPYVLKRLGYEVGYAMGERNMTLDDLGDIWESLRLGKVSSSKNTFVVENCYFCKDLPNVGRAYCKFDEGFITGFLEKSTGEKYRAEEIKCWGMGYEFCEFRIRKLK